MRGAHNLGESGRETTAPHLWLGEEELAASGHLRIATVITAQVPRVKDGKGQTETVTVPWPKV